MSDSDSDEDRKIHAIFKDTKLNELSHASLTDDDLGVAEVVCHLYKNKITYTKFKNKNTINRIWYLFSKDKWQIIDFSVIVNRTIKHYKKMQKYHVEVVRRLYSRIILWVKNQNNIRNIGCILKDLKKENYKTALSCELATCIKSNGEKIKHPLSCIQDLNKCVENYNLSEDSDSLCGSKKN